VPDIANMDSETEKVVPTEEELKGFDLTNPEIVELINHARESDAADRLLTIRQALRKYKKAVFWAMFLSTSLIMEGYDLVIVCPSTLSTPWESLVSIMVENLIALIPQITSFYGQSQFQHRFGVVDSSTGLKVIPPSWQSGLSNSSLVGQLAGLLVNAWTQDRFGCRPTMMFFMAWMTVMIFIPVFAPSLQILAFGEAMCGVSWGVFQVGPSALSPSEIPSLCLWLT
jgi:SP family general alpha glucoside:H+ symporter-like MFS transporter